MLPENEPLGATLSSFQREHRAVSQGRIREQGKLIISCGAKGYSSPFPTEQRGEGIPSYVGLRDGSGLNCTLGLHRAVPAVPEALAHALEGSAHLFCLPNSGFIYLLLLEQSCKPQPLQHCAVPSKNRMGFGLGFWTFFFPPCDHFMEQIYGPFTLDPTFPNCNSLASSSSCYSCLTVLHEQPQKQSLCGGKEKSLSTESVSWGWGRTPTPQEALFVPVNQWQGIESR